MPDDEQAVRGHPANWFFSEHPSDLSGSDLITVPGPYCTLPSSIPTVHSAATYRDLKDYTPLPQTIVCFSSLHGILTSHIHSTLLHFYELHLLVSLSFFVFSPDVSQTAQFSAHFHWMPYRDLPKRKVTSIPCRRSTTAPIKQNKNML